MRKRIGIYGATEEAFQLVPLLLANPAVEISAIFDPEAEQVRARLDALDPSVASLVASVLTDDVGVLTSDRALYAVIDALGKPGFGASFPKLAAHGVQVVSPLTARLLWGYDSHSNDRKTELLQALHEVVESYNLTIDADELFERMLEIARNVTGAEGGSLMLIDESNRELRVRVATGVEPELWPKIRVPMGEGIAGKVAAEARPLRLRGKADRQNFRIVRERLDVESALCVPLVHEGRVLGVLNLHHSTRADAFSEEDLQFTEQLASLDAQIIARAQEHAALRSQAARYNAVRRVHEVLGARAPLAERLTHLCQFVAESSGGGIATLYLLEPHEAELHLAATSLEGGGFGGEYRIKPGQGIDGSVASSREPAFLRRPDGKIAYASLPLLAGDTIAGVLSVQTGPDAALGRGAEETLLEITAATAEGILHAEREARMTMRANKVSAINETGIRMISVTDPAEVLRLGTSGAAMVLEADHAILRVQDEETGRYVIRSYFGSADGRLQEKLFRLDKRISVDAIKRRSAILVRNVSKDASLSQFDTDLQSLIAAPLKREGRVIGTLAIYDKVASDRFYPGNFDDEDLQLFDKFISYLERALANAVFYAETRQYRNFDAETGLPNAGYLAKRIHEEIARSSGREGSLALAVCSIENLAEIEQASDAIRAKRVVQRTVEALRAHLRDFDVLGRTGDAEFTVLMPDPGFSPGDRLIALARSVADDVSKDDALNQPVRVALAFGYAIYPDEGSDRETLLAGARVARIRMV